PVPDRQAWSDPAPVPWEEPFCSAVREEMKRGCEDAARKLDSYSCFPLCQAALQALSDSSDTKSGSLLDPPPPGATVRAPSKTWCIVARRSAGVQQIPKGSREIAKDQ